MDCWSVISRFGDGEVVAFFLVAEEAEIIGLRDGLDGDAPVGSALSDRCSDGVVVARLNGVTAWFLSGEKSVDQNSSATSLIAADHDALAVGD